MTGAGSSTSTEEEEEGGEEEEALEVDQELTEYEKQRLENIKRNEEVLAKLQLKDLATTLKNSVPTPSVVPAKKKRNISLAVLETRSVGRRRSQRLSSMQTSKVVDWSSDSSEAAASESDEPKSGGKAKRRAKKKKKKCISLAKLDDIEVKRKEDVEYEPSGSSDSDASDEDDESEMETETDVTRRRNPSRNQTTPVKRPRSRTLKSPVKRTISLNSPELFQKSPAQLPLPVDLDLDLDGDDDMDLQQALALSVASTVMAPSSSGGTRGKPSPPGPQSQVGFNSASTRRNKRGKSLMYEENEIDAFFVSIAGSKEGRLSKRHLEKAASAHDFIWKEEEINDMIDMFDADGDGQLNLAEFRSMAKRSNLMETC